MGVVSPFISIIVQGMATPVLVTQHGKATELWCCLLTGYGVSYSCDTEW